MLVLPFQSRRKGSSSSSLSMESKQNPPEDPGHTGTEEETVAAKRKRSRRVSFADIEITSVHIFNRDDDHSDSTSSSDPKPSGGTDSNVKRHEIDGIRLFSELGARSSDSPSAFDDKEEEREVFADGKSFFKLAETPSPGSSTAGSAFSNDAEDNFFGPVSTSFIRPPRLSDSAASDENHDITMDSTSFSVHFRSLVRSDSGGDMKTPTRTHLVFDDKSPAPSTTVTNSGSLMALTNARKFTQESSVLLDSGASDGNNSNEMSLVGEDARSYDYGRLSPSLDAIFAEGSKDLANVSPYHLSHTEAASNFECGHGEKDEKDAGSSKIDRTMPTEEVMKDLCGVNERSPDLSVDPHINSYKKPVESVKDLGSNEMGKGMPTQDQEVVKDLSCTAEKSPYLSVPPHDGVSEQSVEADKQSTESAVKMTRENIGVSDIIVGTPERNTNRSLQHGSAFQGSVDRHLNTTAPGHAYTNNDVGCSSDGGFRRSPLPGSGSASNFIKTPAKFSTLTPEAMGSKILLSMESQHRSSFSSLRNSITRLKNLDRSSTPFKRGSEALKLKIRNVQLANSSHNTVLWGSGAGVVSNHVDTPVNHFIHLIRDQKDIQNRNISTGNGTVSTLSANDIPGGIKTISTSSQNVLTETAAGNGECQEDGLFTSVTHKGKLLEDTAVTSPCKYLESLKEMSPLHLVSSSPLNILANTEAGVPVKNILNEMDASETTANSVFYVSALKSLEERSAEGKDYQNHEGGDLKQHPEFSKFISAAPEQNQTARENAVSSGCLIHNAGGMHLFSSESVQSPKGSPLEKLHVGSIESSHVEASVSLQSQNNCIGANDYHKESLHSETLFYENPRTQKRTAEVLGDTDHNSKLAKIICSEVGTSDACEDDLCLESSNYKNERETSGEDMALTKWDDVLNKFSEETRNMLGPEVHQLDHRGMNTMEDLLDDLRKTKDYEVVSFAMQQKSHDQSGNLLKKRSAETLSLLYKVAYEKALLQLNCLKRERLKKLALDLSSAIQGARKLKQSYKESTFSSLEKDHKVGSNCHFYPANDVQEDEVVGKLAGMKQEYELLDEKTKSLADLLYKRCNISTEESSIHTTKPIKDYLKKRMQRILIHDDLKSWRVANFEGSLGCHSIFLDYLGFISQRITVTANPVSLTVTNKLEDRRIEEMFPKMNARCAFTYVFNEEATKESSGSINFSDKIQVTCLLLRNLVDVVVEVQTARLDIKELVKAAFHSPSVGRLDLLLSFVNFKSPQKVTVILDMACLKRGIYPSEILPRHVESYGEGTHNLQQYSLLTKLEADAEGDLSFGFQRIARLCKYIAQVLC